MSALAFGKCDGFADPARPKAILCAWEITNDLQAGSTQQQCYDNMKNYCILRRAAGFKVVVFTCLPRGAAAQFETDRTAINANIVANWATFADALCDVGADATIGVAGSQNNLTYYNADKIHLTDAGYSIVAGLAVAKINSL
jgi:lysophospholipase L1-like esterase